MSKPILTVVVNVYDDFGTPDCLTQTYDSSFEEVRRALRVAIDNLQGRLNAPQECPFGPKSGESSPSRWI